jgi:DNA-directed RNA polymerase subunit RPC12/RpoP
MQDTPEPSEPQRGRAARAPAARARVKATDFICGKCGYDFRGLRVDSRCPECGTPIVHSFAKEKPTSGFAVTALVLGIISVVSCFAAALPGLLLGPLAIVFGVLAVNQKKAGRAGAATGGLALAGLICGGIGSLLSYGFWALTLLGGNISFP